MNRIQVETHDPWAFVRDNPNSFTSFSVQPTTKATVFISTSEGVRIGWSLFWRSLWWTMRRRRSIEFWMEGEQ